MSAGKLVWDQDGQHFYETGVKNAVLYVMGSNGYQSGVAWNGITGITESPSGAEATAIYADNIKYLNLYSKEEFGGTIEAYTYPDEFAQCDGSASPMNGENVMAGVYLGQQQRKQFAICYRTEYGNDTLGEAYGYKIHIIYGCKASPSEKAYSTINDSPEAITFSWEVSTTPTSDVPSGMNPTSTMVFDSHDLGAAKMTALENKLYGTNAGQGGTPAATEPTLLSPAGLVALLQAVTE